MKVNDSAFKKNGLDVEVIKTGEDLSVGVVVHELGKCIMLTPEQAKTMAFHLVQCADYIKPAFAEETHTQSSNFFANYNAAKLRKIKALKIADQRRQRDGEDDDFEDAI